MEPWRERLDALCTLLLPRAELSRGTLSVLVELYKDRRRQGFTCPPALLTALIEVIERQCADRSVAARACRALAFITAEPQNRAAAGVRAARAVLAAMAHGEVGVRVEGCAALKTLALDAAVAALLSEPAGLDALAVAMRSCQRNAEVQWLVVECLYHLCATDAGRARVGQHAELLRLCGDVSAQHGKFELPGRWLLALWSLLLLDPKLAPTIAAQNARGIAEMRAFHHDSLRHEWAETVLSRLP